jgi:hypothetical protein
MKAWQESSLQMNWYWLITGYERDDRPFYVSSEGDLDGHEWWNFDEGNPIRDWKSLAWVKSTSARKDGPPDDGLANHFALLIFSARMRLALEKGEIKGIQYLPICVLKSDNSEYPGYSIANILDSPSALDREKSDFSVFPQDYFALEDRGRISRVRKAVLKAEALRDMHIVRLKDFPEGVYVSQHFVDIYNEHGLSGYSFSLIQLS